MLTEQIYATHPREIGPAAPMRAVNDLDGWQVPDLAVRRALFTVLGDTSGLRYRGRAVDRAGRAGMAISVDSSDGITRDVLIFNPRTGELLAYEMVFLRDPGALGITRPTVVNHELYLDRGRRPTTRR